MRTGSVTTAELTDATPAAIVSHVNHRSCQGPADMGKVMALVKPQVAGRADMGKISALVKAKLS